MPVALTLLAAFALASIGGRYTWPLLPALLVAAALFLLSGARVGAHRGTRAIDITLIAALAFIGLQLAPLPPQLLRALSPHTPELQDAYALAPFGAWRPISIHPAATRAGIGIAFTAALIFWTSREAFSHGGSRAAIRLLAWIGLACAFVSLAQRATAPNTVLWRWSLPDARVPTFGPFVDRNQLATWLVLTISVVSGYLAMHARAHMSDRMRHGAHAAMLALSDGAAVTILGCLAAMLLTLAATLSRSGFIALTAAGVFGMSMSRPQRGPALWGGAAVAAAVVATAAWLNLQGLAQRIVTTLAPGDADAVGRLAIWRDTLRIIKAFPVLGTGEGTFADAMFVYQVTARQVLFNHAHNEYLQLMTEGGIVLVAIAVAGAVLLARAACAALAGDDGSHRFVRIGACAGLVAIAVQSIWETGLRAPANLFLAALLAGLAIAGRSEPPSEVVTA